MKNLKFPSYDRQTLSPSKGFTIVELLVVIVVIGILASITVVSYTGVTQKAVVVTLQSDLSNASKQLKLYHAINGSYPTAIDLNVSNCPTSPTPDSTNCIKSSTSNSYLSYISDGNSFSLTAINTNGTTYTVTDNLAPYIPVPITAIAAITGIAEVNQTLTAGALTPAGATASYQWQSATTVGGTYINISGATSNTYTLVSGDATKYLKVVATGTNGYSGTVTSVATAQIQPSTWIAGIAATPMAGKFVRNADLGTTMQYKTTATAVTSSQGAIGLDLNYLSNMSLFNPQSNPGVDFSDYPAQNACKAIGGRLPNMQELLAIYAGRVTYGNNFQSEHYWSSTEYGNTTAYNVYFLDGGAYAYAKTAAPYVRCVSG